MCAKIVTPPQPKSREQALNSLMALCARAERSSGDAYRLMTKWGVAPQEQEWVLGELCRERFIDDERYTRLFIGEKSRLNGWGAYKIRVELQRKGVASDIIEEGLLSLDRESQRERLCELLQRRMRSLKYDSKYQLQDKLMRYGASRGYDIGLVGDCVREVIDFL